eukprot:UN04233
MCPTVDPTFWPTVAPTAKPSSCQSHVDKLIDEKDQCEMEHQKCEEDKFNIEREFNALQEQFNEVACVDLNSLLSEISYVLFGERSDCAESLIQSDTNGWWVVP